MGASRLTSNARSTADGSIGDLQIILSTTDRSMDDLLAMLSTDDGSIDDLLSILSIIFCRWSIDDLLAMQLSIALLMGALINYWQCRLLLMGELITY